MAHVGALTILLGFGVLAALGAGFTFGQTIPSLQYILLGYQGETRAITPCADLASYEQTTIELFEAARDRVVYNPGHQQRSQATI